VASFDLIASPMGAQRHREDDSDDNSPMGQANSRGSQSSRGVVGSAAYVARVDSGKSTVAPRASTGASTGIPAAGESFWSRHIERHSHGSDSERGSWTGSWFSKVMRRGPRRDTDGSKGRDFQDARESHEDEESRKESRQVSRQDSRPVQTSASDSRADKMPSPPPGPPAGDRKGGLFVRHRYRKQRSKGEELQ